MTKRFLMLWGFCLAFAFQATAPAQTITNQPQSITINNASDATFTVGASNALTYQWQFNTTNLSDGGNITGSTNATLTLENVTSNQAGSYTVVINGSVTSSNAVLSIVPGTIVTFTFSGFIGGGVSNVDVQLFDHDKPATVENFIHYITAGAFTNMFFERCLPGFVLQGGDYGATDQTNTNSPMTGWDIAGMFTAATNQNPPFPAQVDSEFGVGPVIHNSFGTLAMALGSASSGATLTNSASCGFYFNLTDNSVPPTNLDAQGFTVFGRILDGTNVLQYFNTLAYGSGIITNGKFFDDVSMSTNLSITNLPVNYTGTKAPANTNLVFCNFSFQTTPPVDTTPPTVSITSPGNALWTNGSSGPVTGTASDNVGLADVLCIAIPQPASDGTYPNGGVWATNYATGTTNWSDTIYGIEIELLFGIIPYSTYAPLPPGSYDLSVQSQDGAGNLSPATNQFVTITAIMTNGNGTVSFTNSDLNPVGYPLQDGTNYVLAESPASNWLFAGWSAGSATVISPTVSFTMGYGLLLNATFISNGIPNSIAFTYPSANAVLSNSTFNITGTITNAPLTPVTVVCQVYSTTTYQAVGPSLTNSGTTNWSVLVTNLPADSYTVQVIAMDSGGNSTVTNEDFSVVTYTPLQLIILGNGTVSGATNGEYLQDGQTFQATATPGPGEIFYSWNDGTGIYTNLTQTFTMTNDMTLIAEFISNTVPRVIAFTYPTANASLNTNSFLLKGTITPSVKSAQITCQIFSLSTGLEAMPPLTTNSTNTWSVAVSNLPPDDYEVEAVADYAGGKSTAISEKFAVLHFSVVTGTFNGLFMRDNGPVAPTNSGFLTITVGTTGTFSGRLLFPAYPPVSLDSKFFANGSLEISYSSFYGQPLSLILYLGLTNRIHELTGYIYSRAQNGWVSPLLGYHAVTKLTTNSTPATGKYILSLNQTNGSNTNGYATLSIGSTGILTLSGMLPDDATFSQSTGVSDGGAWALYAVPTGYKTNGMLMGWETNDLPNSGSGQLYWYKPPHIGTYDTNGVNTNVISTATNYLAPAAGAYSIVFQGGTLGVPVTNELTMARAGDQFAVPTHPVPADKLVITLSTSGVLTGHFVNTNGNKTLDFTGAFFGQTQGGSGFILEGGGQTGFFTLESEP